MLGSNSRLWQLNEPVSALSVEPALAESLLDEAQGLQGLVSSADTAVSELLTSQQAAVIEALRPAQELKVQLEMQVALAIMALSALPVTHLVVTPSEAAAATAEAGGSVCIRSSSSNKQGLPQ